MTVTILIDTEYLETTTRDLRAHFSHEMGRELPLADLARWADCMVLDGGLRPGDNSVQLVLVHPKEKKSLEQFVPGDFAQELHQQAFADNLGEFSFQCVAVEDLVSPTQMMEDCLTAITADKEHQSDLILVVAQEAPKSETAAPFTLCNMQPESAHGQEHILIGFSLLAALGINANDL